MLGIGLEVGLTLDVGLVGVVGLELLLLKICQVGSAVADCF